MSDYFVSAKKDCFGHYLSDIGRYDNLTAEQEYQYGLDIQKMLAVKNRLKELDENASLEQKALYSGCSSVRDFKKCLQRGAIAKDRMLKHNLRLVVFIAKRYNNRGVDIDDLVQEGNLGLIKAIEKFNPELGYKFSTYGTWWIKQSIIRAVANQSRLIRLPIHIYDLLNRLKKTERSLFLTHHRNVKLSELAQSLNLRMDKLQALQYQTKKVWSLDSERYGSEDSPSITECYRDIEREQDEDFYNEMWQKVEALVGQLDEQEQFIISRRYGLGTHKPHSYKAIADQLSVSSQCVRNASLRIFYKLKRICEENNLEFYEQV